MARGTDGNHVNALLTPAEGFAFPLKRLALSTVPASDSYRVADRSERRARHAVPLRSDHRLAASRAAGSPIWDVCQLQMMETG